MKTNLSIRARRRNSGTMLILVVVLLAIMSTLAVCNSRVLAALKEDLRQIEKRQLQKYPPAAAPLPPAPARPK